MNRHERRAYYKVNRIPKPTKRNISNSELYTLPVTGLSVEKCYAKSLNSCSGSISREHYISENILEQLNGINSKGIPWLSGEEKLLSSNALTTKCLCEKHNSHLSLLDSTAGEVFTFFNQFNKNIPIILTVSGDLFERWCIKTVLGLLSTHKIQYHGETVIPESLEKKWLNILFKGEKLPTGTGLYIFQMPEDQIEIQPGLSVTTLYIDSKFAGLKIKLSGFEFYFTLLDKEKSFKTDHPNYSYILYHPKAFKKERYPQEIHFKWDV